MKPVQFALPLLAAACSVAQAQSEPPRTAFEQIDVARHRGITSVRLQGPLPAGVPEKAPLRARLARSGQTALDAPVELEAGQARIRFRTARLLMNGRYTVELTAKQAVVCTALIQVGEDPQVLAARERLIGWYGRAAATLRQLTATLERRGRFHLALVNAEKTSGKRSGHEQTFRKEFLPEWARALRVAAMDLTTYRRRLLLPYRPELGRELRSLLPALRARRDAWRTAILGETKRGADPGPNTQVEAIAKRLLSQLDRPTSELALWGPGDLGKPPPVPVPGGTFAELGVSLQVPKGAQVLPPVNPIDRLTFRLEGATAIVRVIDRPDEKTPKALREAVELGAWERWDSYKRLGAKPLAADAQGRVGLRLDYTARLRSRDRTAARAGATARVIQLARFPKAGGRTISLILVRAAGKPLPKPLAALEAAW